MENQLREPITRMYEPVIGSKATDGLFCGAHTKDI